MSTKNNPGPFDCYANAAPDEPMFVLLGRDPVAQIVVRLWVELRSRLDFEVDGDCSQDKFDEARKCAKAMREYAVGLGKSEKIDKAEHMFDTAATSIDYEINGPPF